jgi:phosphoesterase RecJ-like protein
MTAASPVSIPAVPGAVVDALGRLRAPVLISHIVPDADALGSMLATAVAWASNTCAPKVALPKGSLSQRLTFLVEWADTAVAKPDDFGSADGFVVLDTAKKDRCNIDKELKKTDWSAGRPVVNIDHHATNTRFGDVNWVIDRAGSTAEMVYYLLRAAERPIGPTVASMLYAGMHTDTIGFSLPTTTASALRACADLLEAGADVARVGEHLCRGQRRSDFELTRIVQGNTKVAADGWLAYSSASYEEIHGAGCTAADIDEQINIPRSLEGVRLAMLFSEGRRGRTRINFRGSGSVTVVELAQQFNGGGHTQAAGAVLDCGLEEAMGRVLPRALEYVARFGDE